MGWIRTHDLKIFVSSRNFIPLKSIFERSCLKTTNRVMQAKQRVKLFEERKEKEQR